MDELKYVRFNPENQQQVMDWYARPKEERITLVLPVNKTNDKINNTITDYMAEEKFKGKVFYNPQIHTYQIDPTGGLTICNTMHLVINGCGEVHVIFDQGSRGTAFDFGMALMHNKKIVLGNDKTVDRTLDDDVLKAILFKTGHSPDDTYFNDIMRTKDCMVKENGVYNIRFKIEDEKITKESLLEFGMLFASQKPFMIYNKRDLEDIAQTEDMEGAKKSYTKVALKLNSLYNA